MRENVVYDAPLRFFHWLFALCIGSSLIITKLTDDDSLIFSYHMIIGFLTLFLLVFRIVWGFMGSHNSRFQSFILTPKQLINYALQLKNPQGIKYAGHNPATSWLAVIMFIFVLGLGVSGYLLTSGAGSHLVEEIHEFFANGMIILVVFHLLGIAFHTFKYKELISLSMVDGKKHAFNEGKVIEKNSNHIIFSVILLASISVFSLYLLKNFNTETKELNVFNQKLQLGENEAEENENSMKDDDKEKEEKEGKEEREHLTK